MTTSPFRIYSVNVMEVQGGDCKYCRELLVSYVYENVNCSACKKAFRTIKQKIPDVMYFIVAYKKPKNIVENVMAVDGLVHKKPSMNYILQKQMHSQMHSKL